MKSQAAWSAASSLTMSPHRSRTPAASGRDRRTGLAVAAALASLLRGGRYVQ
ncbi:MAG TPA: hypothetical protein VF940_09470 [Streptosporangiaceae bacterium]